jgi:hypothetical protein
MAHKAHMLRMSMVQDVFFPEDLNPSRMNEFLPGMGLEGNQQAGDRSGGTRWVDRKRLLHFVKTKVERSQKGRTATLFVIFTICYMTAVVLQRNCRDSQSLIAGMDKYLTTATFRDPDNMDLKTFHDIVTLDDLWLWHHEVLAPKIYSSHYYNGMLQTGKDRSSILTFNRLTTGFRMVQVMRISGFWFRDSPLYYSVDENTDTELNLAFDLSTGTWQQEHACRICVSKTKKLVLICLFD